MPVAARVIPGLFVLMWATGFIGARYAMPWAEPFTFLAARFLLAYAVLLMLPRMGAKRPLTRAEAVNAVIAGLLMHGVYLGCVFWAIDRGMPAGLTALVIGLQPLITAVMAGSLLGERTLPRHWLGLGIGLAGIVIVLWPRLGDIGGGVTAVNVAAVVLAVAGMSAGTIWQKRFVSNADMVGGTRWQYLGGTIVMVAASLVFETQEFELTGELVFAMAWLVLVLSIGAIFLLMYLIREGEVARVASLFYLVPAVTAVLAWLLFDERLSALQIGGMVVTTIGVALATAQPATRIRAPL